MNKKFATDYKINLENLNLIDPVKHGRTRNYLDGAVTSLSPYILRRVIGT
jgi:deoxyribodipyrimidine photo-lyase